MRCPGCNKLFFNETDLATEILSDLAEYRRSHFGHNWHWAPVFRFIEIGEPANIEDWLDAPEEHNELWVRAHALLRGV